MTSPCQSIPMAAAIFAAVLSVGRVEAQVDWTSRLSGVPELLSGVTYGNGRWVVVGENGTILTSTDAITWTPAVSGTAMSLRTVTWGDGLFVAVGEQGTLLTSPDASVWTARNSGVTIFLSGIAHANGLYVAVGGSGQIITSTDGLAWTPTPSATFRFLQTVAPGGGRFVAGGLAGTIVRSDDGLAWSIASSGTGSYISGVVWRDGMFYVAAQGGTILASPTGQVWTPRTSGSFAWLYAIATDGRDLVIVGEEGTILSSPDGDVWTPQNSGVGTDLRSVAFGDGQYVAVGDPQLGAPGFGVVLTSPGPISLEEALDGDCLAWSTSVGPLAWQTQTEVTSDGMDAAVSAAGLAEGQASILETTLHGPATLTFDWKLSAGPDDSLGLSVDGTPAAGLTGEQDWRPESIAIGPGPHSLRWTYARGGSTAAGQNLAWLDRVAAKYTYDDWAAAYFDAGELADPAISGRDADPNGNGLVNLAEYLFANDPRADDGNGSGLPASEILPEGPRVSFVFRRKVKHGAAAIARLECSTNLDNWQPEASVEEILDSDGVIETVRLTHTGSMHGSTRKFYRLAVVALP